MTFVPTCLCGLNQIYRKLDSAGGFSSLAVATMKLFLKVARGRPISNLLVWTVGFEATGMMHGGIRLIYFSLANNET
jgi:hypothetical protein